MFGLDVALFQLKRTTGCVTFGASTSIDLVHDDEGHTSGNASMASDYDHKCTLAFKTSYALGPVLAQMTTCRFLRDVQFGDCEQKGDVADNHVRNTPSDVPCKFSGGYTDDLLDAAAGGATSPAYIELQAYHVRATTVQFANSVNIKTLVEHPSNCSGLCVDSVVQRGDITLKLIKALTWGDDRCFAFGDDTR